MKMKETQHLESPTLRFKREGGRERGEQRERGNKEGGERERRDKEEERERGGEKERGGRKRGEKREKEFTWNSICTLNNIHHLEQHFQRVRSAPLLFDPARESSAGAVAVNSPSPEPPRVPTPRHHNSPRHQT